jgi:glutaconate CoA-transferase subunit B
VVTDLGVLERDDGELTLTELHPDVRVEDAQEATGWDLRVAPDLRLGQQPTGEELDALRALKPANEDTVGS